jgi:Transposase, Mutator family
VGSIELAIPGLREGSYFPDFLIRRRADQALVPVVATRYLLGVSTRRVEKLVETLGITVCPAHRCRRWPRAWTSRSSSSSAARSTAGRIGSCGPMH